MSHLVGVDDDMFYDNLLERIAERCGSEERMRALVSLGLVSDAPVEKLGSPLDTLSHHLAKVLKYGRDERDMILLRHNVTIRWPDRRIEERGINMVSYGDTASSGGHSAMARTVGLPCAIATKMVLDKEIQKRGMVLPFSKDIYKPMLMRLENEGIKSTETSKYVS